MTPIENSEQYSDQSFDQYYERDLFPHLQELEERRRQIVGRVTTAGFAAALFSVVAAVAGVAYTNTLGAGLPGIFIGLFALVLGGIIFAILYHFMTKGYVAEFKERVIGNVVRFVDPNLSYHQEGSIEESVYMGSQIFPTRPDRYRGEDLVRGKIGQTAVEFSEVHSEYRTVSTDKDGKRQEQWHTIFRGIFFIADFNKHFAGQTVVLPDVAERMFGRLGQKLQSWNFARQGELVKLEDPEFEQRFVVYSDDQVEARYILSTSLMARIVGFANKSNNQIHLSFVASKLYIAISYQKNLFEPKLFQSLLDKRLLQEYLADLSLAVEIVADLNLNNRIWTKQ